MNDSSRADFSLSFCETGTAALADYRAFNPFSLNDRNGSQTECRASPITVTRKGWQLSESVACLNPAFPVALEADQYLPP